MYICMYFLPPFILAQKVCPKLTYVFAFCACGWGWVLSWQERYVFVFSCFHKLCLGTWPRTHPTNWSERTLHISHTGLFLSNCLFYCSFGYIKVNWSILSFQTFHSPNFPSWPRAISCTCHFGLLSLINNWLIPTYKMPHMIGTNLQSLIVVCPKQFLFPPFSNSIWSW
jgi:hypothetical protein